MKKLILSTVLVLIAGLCFAQNDETDEATPKKTETSVGLEVTLGFPIYRVHSPSPHDAFGVVSNDEDTTTTISTAIGTALLFDFGKRVGLAFDMDFSVSTEDFAHSLGDSSSKTLFGANAFLGPVIFLHKSSFLTVPLAIGVDMHYWGYDQWTPMFTTSIWLKTHDIQLGPSFYLGVNYHFNDKIYIFTRINAAVNLFRWHKTITGSATSVEQADEFEMAFGWGVKPTLGVGITFAKNKNPNPYSLNR